MNALNETADSTSDHLGKPLTRREDAPLLAGRGIYCDDVSPRDVTYGHVVRSPYAHADIVDMDLSEARAAPGVLAILTAEDLIAAEVSPIKPNWLVGDIAVPIRTVLAKDRVRFVGDPVAFIVATSREAAVDAAERVVIRYEERAAIVDEEVAFAPDAPQLHDNVARNRVGVYDLGGGDIKTAFAEADRIVKLRLVNNRLIPSPIEPRTVLAEYDAYTQKFAIHVGSQVPHMHRRWIAETMGIPRASPAYSLAGCRRRLRRKNAFLSRRDSRSFRRPLVAAASQMD